MEVCTEIGKWFQSRGALKQNALSAADLNVLEYILGWSQQDTWNVE